MAPADSLDALLSGLPDQPGLPLEDALAIVREGAGTFFDPSVVPAFLRAARKVPGPE